MTLMPSNTGVLRVSVPISESLWRHRRQLLPVVIVALASACLLSGYEAVRSPSASLFVEAYGKGYLPLIQGLMPLGIIVALLVYTKLLSLVGPRKTLVLTSLGSGLSIAMACLALRSGFKPAAGLLVMISETYVVLVVEQYWSLLNSSLDEATARRVNGPICGIASLGAISGGLVVAQFAQSFGSLSLLFMGAATCIPAALLGHLAYRKFGEKSPGVASTANMDAKTAVVVDVDRGAPELKKADVRSTLGLTQLFENPMLVRLILIVLATQVVATVTSLGFQGAMADAFPNVDDRTAWQGGFYAALNSIAALFQFVLTPFLLRFVPMGVLHVGMPCIQLFTCAWAAFQPTLIPSALALMVFKSFDYSLFRAAKEILYIPLSFDVRYRAKELIDVFGYRFGKGGTSLVISGLKALGIGFSGPIFSWIAIAALGTWTVLVWPLTKHYRRVDDPLAKG